jgi:histidinol-phosphatase (PHP family)
MLTDYHMHLADDDAPLDSECFTTAHIERYVVRARECGVDEIGFTDHVFRFREAHDWLDHPLWRDDAVGWLDDYRTAVRAAGDAGLPVKLGLEVDYVGPRQDALAEILDPYPWDYLLGSIHWLDGLALDSAPDAGVWTEWPVDEVWRRYFEALGELAASGHVDVLAHPDLAKIFGRRPERIEYPQLAGVALEISTNGRYKPVGELYPDRDFLGAVRLPITLASDAHVPENVGRDFDLALDFARAAGYETVTVFDQRRARQEPLG